MIRRFSALLFVSAFCPITAQAGSIELSGVNGDALYEANGQPMGTTTSILWELGTFQSGFTPGPGNVNDWAANWRLLDGVAYNQSKQFITERIVLVNNPDAGTGGFLWEQDENDPPLPATNAEVFRAGNQLYLWAYNDKTVTPDTEWALVTSYQAGTPWTLNSFSGNELGFPVQWTLAAADTVVFGGLNDVAVSPNMVDPGGSFTVQTALVLAPVPEPGSAGVVAAALGFLGIQ